MLGNPNNIESLVGHVDDISSFGIVGWAADLRVPNAPVVVTVSIDGVEVGRIRADLLREDLALLGNVGDGRHGFQYRFGTPLPSDQDHTVVVTFLDSGAVVPAGQVLLRGSRVPVSNIKLISDEKKILQPLLVSSTGRSGSTILMKLLIDKAEVAGGNIFPYEIRVGSYFSNLHRVASSRADLYGPDVTEIFDVHEDKITVNPFFNNVYKGLTHDPAFLSSFFGQTASEELGRVLRRITDTFYAELAEEKSRSAAKYFVEKCDVTRLSRRSFRGLYTQLKEILLVRDLRDVVCSFRRFFSTSPGGSIVDHLAKVGSVVCEAWRTQDESIMVVKYEELIFNRDAVLSAIAKFLEIPDIWSQDADVEMYLHNRHGTSESPESSVGRWKHELTLEERDQCGSMFNSYLSMFGYV